MVETTKIFLWCTFKATICFIAIFGFLELIQNSHQITHQSSMLERMTHNIAEPTKEELKETYASFHERVNTYEQQIADDHLLDGMVVYRQADGGINHVCDSLLFSSLRFIALQRLGKKREARNAWDAIRNSKQGGLWIRHPQCAHTPTSRDMIIGLSAAMTQQPDGFEAELFKLMGSLKLSKGFVSKSAPYVGYATPSLQEAIRRMTHSKFNADHENTVHMPFRGNLSFSTLELDVLVIPDGFPTHLLGLLSWIEMEQDLKQKNDNNFRGTRSVLWELGKMVSPLTYESLYNQRLKWTTTKLIKYNPSNLFFQYLYLRAHNALNKKTKHLLLNKLLAMKQFPKDRLPMNCDRKADYLWQRSKQEYDQPPSSKKCTVQFPGVDFLWLGSLLIEKETFAEENTAHFY